MEKRKRIAFIIGAMSRGGAERVVSVISNYYAGKDWNVDIILLLGNQSEYQLDPRINIISLTSDHNRIIQLPKWLYGIRSYIKKYKPDSILSFVARINIITAIAGIGIKKNLIVSERNDPSKDGRSKLVKYLTEIIYPRVTKVVFQTEEAQSYFSNRIKRNSAIIYNPVPKITEKYTGKLDTKIIITVGRLAPQKNQQLLIRSFKKIVELYPDYTLSIYGEGSLRDDLAKLIKSLNLSKSVFLHGQEKKIHKKMAQGELFILTSDYEGLSNALLEAMSIGMPVISTECAGATEVIKTGENGILVPVGDEEKITEAIKFLIKNKKAAKKLGDKALFKSKEFSSNKILKEWEYVLEESIEE